MGIYSSIEDGYYDLMEFMDKKLHVPAEKFFIEPIEGRGIPSFPVFIFLIISIIVLAALALRPPALIPATLQISILSEGKPVAGVTVAAISATGEFRETSNEEGIAIFNNLPPGEYTVKIDSIGYEPAVKALVLNKNGQLEISLVKIMKEVAMTFMAMDDSGQILSSALIEVTASGLQKNALTDSEGKAEISFPENSQLSVLASKDGYESAYLSLKNYQGTANLRLIRKQIFGRLQVKVTDEAGRPLEAVVRLFDAGAGIEPFLMQRTADGISIFTSLNLGQRLKVVAAADGFKEGRQDASIKEDGRIAFRLEKEPLEVKSDNSTSIKVFDANGKSPLLAAQVRIFNLKNELLFEGSTDSSGMAKFDLNIGAYYAIIEANGYLYSKLFIAGGQQKEIGLIKETPENTAELKLTVINEDGKAIANASLLFLDEDGNVVPPIRARASNPKGEFAARIARQYYQLKVAGGSLAGEKSFDLNSSASIEIILLYPRGKLMLRALDLDSGKSVLSEMTPSFMAISTDSVNKKTKAISCKANPCEIELVAMRKHSLNITASGYFGAEYSLLDNELKPDETLTREVALKNTTSTTKLKIEFRGFVDFQNSSNIISKIMPGNSYVGKFAAYFDPDARRSGIFLRVGSELEVEGDTSSVPDGYISAFSVGGSPAPSKVMGSNSYLAGVCALSSNPGKARYAFADFPQKGSQTIYIGFKANPASGSPELFELFFGAYTEMSNGSLASDPKGIRSSDDCLMQTYSASLPFGPALKASPSPSPSPSASPKASAMPSASGSPSPKPSPNASASPSPKVDFNECPLLEVSRGSTNALSASCQRIVMKVDSIFPADAIELKFTSASGPATVQRLDFKDESGNPVSGCLKYDAGRSLLLYNPTDAVCPARYKPEGNDVPSATFTMVLEMALATAPVEIPIIILNDQSFPEGKVGFEAIEASTIEYRSEELGPPSYYGPDFDKESPLRAAYVLNNRQLTYEYDGLIVEENGEKVFDALVKDSNRGSAFLFAWDADERPDAAIAVRTPSGTAPIIFPSQNGPTIGSLLTLLDEKAYESQGASETRIEMFLDLARSTAANSVFRRGGTKPYSDFFSLASRPIIFSAVIPESADNVFNYMDSFGVSVDSAGIPSACKARLGIYKLSAMTNDGLNWEIGSADAKLSPMTVSKTTNGENCPAITACNLFDSYYGLPEISKYSGAAHCLGFEWPIVPYGKLEINDKMLDLRNAIYLGIGESKVGNYNMEYGPEADNPPDRESILLANYPVFSLSMPQNGSLENAEIFYKLNKSETAGAGVLNAGSYSIGLAPDYFGG